MTFLGVGECWARDGIQSEAWVATDRKLEVIAALSGTGIRRIELTAFSRSDVMPQFDDAGAVVQGYARRPGVDYVVIVPNEKGLDRALSAQGDSKRIDVITTIVAASDAYNQRAMGRGTYELVGRLGKTIGAARDHSFHVVGCVGTAWGCPLTGPVPPHLVLEICQSLIAFGADEIMVGDTTGEANPRTAEQLIAMLVDACGAPVTAHFHDTRGAGLANAVAAIDSGATWVDSTLGGTGGYADPAGVHTGNVCSEDLVSLLAAMGRLSEVDIAQLLHVGERVEAIIGRRLHSRVQRAGLPSDIRDRAAV